MAPSAEPGGVPGATLWWDGVTISTDVSDAEAAYAALASARTTGMVAANNDRAVRLMEGIAPGAAATGVAATAQGGAKPHPMIPQIGRMQNALGSEPADFLKGAG